MVLAWASPRAPSYLNGAVCAFESRVFCKHGPARWEQGVSARGEMSAGSTWNQICSSEAMEGTQSATTQGCSALLWLMGALAGSTFCSWDRDDAGITGRSTERNVVRRVRAVERAARGGRCRVEKGLLAMHRQRDIGEPSCWAYAFRQNSDLNRRPHLPG